MTDINWETLHSSSISTKELLLLVTTLKDAFDKMLITQGALIYMVENNIHNQDFFAIRKDFANHYTSSVLDPVFDTVLKSINEYSDIERVLTGNATPEEKDALLRHLKEIQNGPEG